MSIRPKVMTVFGIDDYNGPGPEESFWESRVRLTDEEIERNSDLSYVKDCAYDYRRKEWRWYPDLVHFGLDSEATRGIVGLIQSRDFDSDTFRVLGMIYPEFFESGHRDVPLDSLELQAARLRHDPPFRPCGSIEFQEHWFYPQGYYRMTPVWAFVTKWLLDSIEIKTVPERYKWMLVWEWS